MTDEEKWERTWETSAGLYLIAADLHEDGWIESSVFEQVHALYLANIDICSMRWRDVIESMQAAGRKQFQATLRAFDSNVTAMFEAEVSVPNFPMARGPNYERNARTIQQKLRELNLTPQVH